MISVTQHSPEDAIENTLDDKEGELVDPDPWRMEVAEEELRSTCARSDVPVDADDVLIVFSKWAGTALGCASAYGCGEYRAAFDEHNRACWEVDRQPDGYVIHISANGHDAWVDPEKRIRKTVRHEIAHICGWETELVTYEDRGNHSMWLDQLDAR